MTTYTSPVQEIADAQPYTVQDIQENRDRICDIGRILGSEISLDTILSLGIDVKTAGAVLPRIAQTFAKSLTNTDLATALYDAVSCPLRKRFFYALHAAALSERVAGILMLDGRAGSETVIKRLKETVRSYQPNFSSEDKILSKP